MYLLAVSFLVVVWWVALWGLLELCLQPFVKKPHHAVCVYGGMIAFVITIVWLYPDVYERLT
jgi:hypothetical protein